MYENDNNFWAAGLLMFDTQSLDLDSNYKKLSKLFCLRFRDTSIISSDYLKPQNQKFGPLKEEVRVYTNSPRFEMHFIGNGGQHLDDDIETSCPDQV
ncbi:predicted protein [Sclerotinia sclerotiorum 1980 UF-70]|uniref:Uncharacterized protein n=1 Tax=Sclerotinia sclerotiorum (strain ATCC 18683 / 1980 / Ss-1) TaxID=665079 RepID=A7EI43_SCLS1|nr:predicted protein [Sclerotinia sclerotiorum 1980 UF-70]EDO02509.1 predicted protein [Sclerotinia sclerotiorum 1980 UF-70]